MKNRKWIVRSDGAICLDGYPIRIVRKGCLDMPFKLEQDGRSWLPYWTLACAQMDACSRADELDAMAALPVAPD